MQNVIRYLTAGAVVTAVALVLAGNAEARDIRYQSDDDDAFIHLAYDLNTETFWGHRFHFAEPGVNFAPIQGIDPFEADEDSLATTTRNRRWDLDVVFDKPPGTLDPDVEWNLQPVDIAAQLTVTLLETGEQWHYEKTLTATPIPAPGAVALLAMGLLGLLRLRVL